MSSFVATGLVEGETEAVLKGVNALNSTRKDAGEYQRSIGNDDSKNQNYEVTNLTAGKIIINKATATVKANNLQTIYNGNTQSVAGYDVSGLKGTDQKTLFNIQNSAATGRNAGTYDNIVSGNTSTNNYNIIYENGVLNIAQKDLIANVTAMDKVYDATTKVVTNAQLNGLIEGDDIQLITTGQFIDKNAGQDKVVNVMGNLSGSDAQNYKVVNSLDTTADIEKAKLQVRGNSLITDYTGQPYSVTGFTAEGLVGGETKSVLTDVKASGATSSNVGTYYNQVSGSDRNYDIVFTAGMLQINEVAVLEPWCDTFKTSISLILCLNIISFSYLDDKSPVNKNL